MIFTTVTLSFNGQVTYFTDSTGLASNYFNSDDSFSYSVTIDSENSTPLAGRHKRDLHAYTAFNFSFGSYSAPGRTGDLFFKENDSRYGAMILFSHHSLPVNQNAYLTNRMISSHRAV